MNHDTHEDKYLAEEGFNAPPETWPTPERTIVEAAHRAEDAMAKTDDSISAKDLADYMDDEDKFDSDTAGHSPVVSRERAERVARWGARHTGVRNRRRRAHGHPRGR